MFGWYGLGRFGEPKYLMHGNGVREAAQQTLVFIVGLHEEVEVFPRLQIHWTHTDRQTDRQTDTQIDTHSQALTHTDTNIKN